MMKKHEKTCRKTAELISHRGQNDVIISGKEHRRRQAGASFFSDPTFSRSNHSPAPGAVVICTVQPDFL